MLRAALLGIGILLVTWSTASADDFSGQVTALDIAGHSVTLKIEDKEQKFALSESCKVYRKVGGGRTAAFGEAKEGLAALPLASNVIATTEIGADSSEQVVRIKIEGMGKPLPKPSPIADAKPAPPVKEGAAIPPATVPPAKVAPAKVTPAKIPLPKVPPPKVVAKPPVKKINDVNGTVTKVDLIGRALTVKVDGAAIKYSVPKECHLFVNTTDAKKPRLDVATHGLADASVGKPVTITIDSNSGADVVTMIKIGVPPKKK